ncbi:uncharacterized protein B0I36DRAFT_366946 [Microdochium trichocladiopsis]|uniref:SET domain-containing protein n=1 Tax=Microdochium trichocladiopsis TaxID=1682393 RepID=A0A9P8XZT1_9PEZI|nr:uncharacterized protein B0I36DRAFT_366946 [Microdochium trichocladiopsis]KAH7025050.1 hypothetical protein B0I36DRAFT_366946 [Microdochium trichocladiopsis]
MSCPPLFVIQPSPGKGNGVFARRDTSAGTLIFSEPALLTLDASLPARQACRSLAACFARLPAEDQDKIRSLHCPVDTVRSRRIMLELAHSDNGDDDESGTTQAGDDPGTNAGSSTHSGAGFPASKRRKRTVSASSGTSSANSRAAVPPQQQQPLTEADIAIYLAATSNGIAFLGAADGKTYTGLFPSVAARMNHTCEPNVVFAVDHNGVYHLRARRDLQAGEELLVSYLPRFMAWEARRRTLGECHGFVCGCARCVEGASRGVAGGGSAGDRGRGPAPGFVPASQIHPTFEVLEHQRASMAGIDLAELHAWIRELKSREWNLRKKNWGQEPAELFGLAYAIAEAHCGMGLVLRRPSEVESAIAYHELAARVGAKYWSETDVFVREQRGCVMALKVELRKFSGK